MSGYTSGNNAPTLMAQAPNRKGNQSKHTPGAGGVTAVTRPQGSTAYSKGHQGAPAVCCDATKGRGQKVQVSRPAVSYGNNDGYRNSSYLA
jgi:hypothetical protein